MKYQIIGIAILAVFYIAFFVKLLGQKKRGIRTHQVGKGNKSGKTKVVEKIMGFATVAVVVAELVSIILDWAFLELWYVRLAGAALGVLGLIVYITGMVTMRDSWRAGFNEEEKTELVTRGIYRISRNPAFLGFDLVYIGLMIMFMNPVINAFSLLAILSLHLQICQEERFLEKVFGEEYIQYRKKVRRYI